MAGTMSDPKEQLAADPRVPEEQCTDECPAGLDECADCGACDHCAHDASLNEAELPPNWLRFIENSKRTAPVIGAKAMTK